MVTISDILNTPFHILPIKDSPFDYHQFDVIESEGNRYLDGDNLKISTVARLSSFILRGQSQIRVVSDIYYWIYLPRTKTTELLKMDISNHRKFTDVFGYEKGWCLNYLLYITGEIDRLSPSAPRISIEIEYLPVRHHRKRDITAKIKDITVNWHKDIPIMSISDMDLKMIRWTHSEDKIKIANHCIDMCKSMDDKSIKLTETRPIVESLTAFINLSELL